MEDKLILKDSNLSEIEHHSKLMSDNYSDSYIEFLINSKENLCENNNVSIHSSLGVPICLKDDILGFIIVEHEAYNYFNDFHVKFIKSICNKVAICVENNNLYNKIKEISNRDYLTGLFNRNYFYKEIIEKLPELQKAIIRMKDIEEYEVEEIAEITGTKLEAVRMNLSRARKKVREEYIKWTTV